MEEQNAQQSDVPAIDSTSTQQTVTPPSGSAMSGLAATNTPAQTAPSINDTELYTVDEKKETVKGQLEENYSDFDNKLFQRIGASGKEKANARGLGNSTIATAGAMGAVLDKAGEWATTDAGIYNNRKTETVRSVTAIESSNIGARAQIESSTISARAQVAAANIGARSALAVANANNVAAKERNDSSISGDKDVAQLRESGEYLRAAVKIAADERVATMSNETQLKAAEIREQGETSRADRAAYNAVYADTNTAIANIDPNAKPKSQDEQARRIFDFHTIRLESLSKYQEVLNRI